MSNVAGQGRMAWLHRPVPWCRVRPRGGWVRAPGTRGGSRVVYLSANMVTFAIPRGLLHTSRYGRTGM